MDKFVLFGGKKTKPNKPNLSPQQCWGLNTNLKKQSQFVGIQVSLNSCLKGV